MQSTRSAIAQTQRTWLLLFAGGTVISGVTRPSGLMDKRQGEAQTNGIINPFSYDPSSLRGKERGKSQALHAPDPGSIPNPILACRFSKAVGSAVVDSFLVHFGSVLDG